MAQQEYRTFEDVKERLDQIVDAVSDDDLALDDALALYEEAVSLGLRASELLEADIDAQKELEEMQEGAQEGDGAPSVAQAASQQAANAKSDDSSAPGEAE